MIPTISLRRKSAGNRVVCASCEPCHRHETFLLANPWGLTPCTRNRSFTTAVFASCPRPFGPSIHRGPEGRPISNARGSLVCPLPAPSFGGCEGGASCCAALGAGIETSRSPQRFFETAGLLDYQRPPDTMIVPTRAAGCVCRAQAVAPIALGRAVQRRAEAIGRAAKPMPEVSQARAAAVYARCEDVDQGDANRVRKGSAVFKFFEGSACEINVVVGPGLNSTTQNGPYGRQRRSCGNARGGGQTSGRHSKTFCRS